MSTAAQPPSGPSAPSLRTALFVDFDNVYLTLHAADPRCAEAFATDPVAWIQWLESGRYAGTETPRRILLRRCYLNPSSFRRYRADFTRAGFRVMDCPSLTRAGKSSSDIHMVMDILDALQHETRFDEFLILSGDADFTPVLQRLREHDRRTAVLVVGPAAAAFKASSDLVIEETEFVERGLGLPSDALVAAHEARPPASIADSELLQRIATALRETIAAHGPLLATELPGTFKRFPEFAKSNWLGFFSLRGLTDALTTLDPGLAIVEGDPWRLEWRPLHEGEASTGDGEMSRADASAFARRVQELVGAPPLLPAEHAAAFEALADHLADEAHDAVTVARAAAETLLEQDHPVPRSHLTFILQTLAGAGFELPTLRGVSPRALADRYREAIAGAFDQAGSPLGDAEMELLDRWICRPVRERTTT